MVFSASNQIGYGFVIHDSDGTFVCARNGVLASAPDPLLAEVLSCKEALSWIKQANLSRCLH
ncbi:hypothetical protein LguiA_033580 [Lonicera macranthoides]